jgi:hypothetical protein
MRHSVKKILMKATTFFKPHFDQRSAHKVMGPQSSKNPNFGNFGTPIWEFWDKMPFGCGPRGEAQKYYKGGKVVASPKFGPWWILWIQIWLWFVLPPKMFNLCNNQLVVWFVQIRVVKCLSFFLFPYRSSSMPLYPQSATSQRACPDSLPFCCLHFKLTFESIKKLGSVSQGDPIIPPPPLTNFDLLTVIGITNSLPCPKGFGQGPKLGKLISSPFPCFFLPPNGFQ